MYRSDIADYLGLTTETVSRELTRLKRKGILTIAQTGVQLRDKDTLFSLCEIA